MNDQTLLNPKDLALMKDENQQRVHRAQINRHIDKSKNTYYALLWHLRFNKETKQFNFEQSVRVQLTQTFLSEYIDDRICVKVIDGGTDASRLENRLRPIDFHEGLVRKDIYQFHLEKSKVLFRDAQENQERITKQNGQRKVQPSYFNINSLWNYIFERRDNLKNIIIESLRENGFPLEGFQNHSHPQRVPQQQPQSCDERVLDLDFLGNYNHNGKKEDKMDLVAFLSSNDNVYIYDRNFNQGKGNYVGLSLVRPRQENSKGLFWLNFTKRDQSVDSDDQKTNKKNSPKFGLVVYGSKGLTMCRFYTQEQEIKDPKEKKLTLRGSLEQNDQIYEQRKQNREAAPGESRVVKYEVRPPDYKCFSLDANVKKVCQSKSGRFLGLIVNEEVRIIDLDKIFQMDQYKAYNTNFLSQETEQCFIASSADTYVSIMQGLKSLKCSAEYVGFTPCEKFLIIGYHETAPRFDDKISHLNRQYYVLKIVSMDELSYQTLQVELEVEYKLKYEQQSPAPVNIDTVIFSDTSTQTNWFLIHFHDKYRSCGMFQFDRFNSNNFKSLKDRDMYNESLLDDISFQKAIYNVVTDIPNIIYNIFSGYGTQQFFYQSKENVEIYLGIDRLDLVKVHEIPLGNRRTEEQGFDENQPEKLLALLYCKQEASILSNQVKILRTYSLNFFTIHHFNYELCKPILKRFGIENSSITLPDEIFPPTKVAPEQIGIYNCKSDKDLVSLSILNKKMGTAITIDVQL